MSKYKKVINYEKMFVLASLYYVEKESTLYEAAKEYDISKTSLWRYIHNDLKFVSKVLYNNALNQIKKNKSHKYRKEVQNRKENE